MNIRKVSLNDTRAICDIYNYYIENTAISFETLPVPEKEMEQRISDVLDSGFPFYVGELESKIIGYCYAHTWNNRSAYSTTNEVTIYLDKDETGKSYGYALYDHLFKHIDKEKIHVSV